MGGCRVLCSVKRRWRAQTDGVSSQSFISETLYPCQAGSMPGRMSLFFRSILISLFIYAHNLLPIWLLEQVNAIYQPKQKMATNITTAATVYVSYMSEPNIRGTVSLVLSCLLTLILCVWQALHLNVPEGGQTRYARLLANMRWIIAGVYAPELVVFTAWRQWSSARLLGSIVAGLQRESEDEALSAVCGTSAEKGLHGNKSPVAIERTRRFKWTRTHDFFACTGGFAFEINSSDLALPFLPPDCPQRLTITARGMAFLARCGYLPDVPEVDILDKSKANGLAKALVMVQALWMMLQVLGRLVAGLPVTLLEVNTVAHVFCALCMYCMWWHKPLLAKEPILLTGEWVQPLCAFMYMSSEMSGSVDPSSLRSGTMVKTLLASLHLYSKTPEIDRLAYRSLVHDRVVDTEDEDSYQQGRTFKPMPQSCQQTLQHKKDAKGADTAFFERRPRIRVTTSLEKNLISEVTLHRWRLAAQAMEEYPAVADYQILVAHNGCAHFKTEQLVASYVQNWPQDDLLRNIGGLMVGMVLWLSNLVYGGIHAAAWNDHFPSAVEMWLWRTSAVYISFCGGLWIVLNYVAQAYRPLNEFWEKWMDGKKQVAWNILLGFLVVLCGGALSLARVFIVVEAFISIRELPVTAYDTPDWTQIFPHF